HRWMSFGHFRKWTRSTSHWSCCVICRFFNVPGSAFQNNLFKTVFRREMAVRTCLTSCKGRSVSAEMKTPATGFRRGRFDVGCEGVGSGGVGPGELTCLAVLPQIGRQNCVGGLRLDADAGEVAPFADRLR